MDCGQRSGGCCSPQTDLLEIGGHGYLPVFVFAGGEAERSTELGPNRPHPNARLQIWPLRGGRQPRSPRWFVKQGRG